jgi:hypothetical protein
MGRKSRLFVPSPSSPDACFAELEVELAMAPTFHFLAKIFNLTLAGLPADGPADH